MILQLAKKTCIATVTTDSFAVGTLVTLDSFLRNNSWFTGDIVIICDELSALNREYIKLLYDKIVFLQVSDELLRRVAKLTQTLPEFLTKQPRYYSLETFRLSDYEKVLFLDSDLLFRGSVQELFDLKNDLIACGDGAFYNNRGRRWGSGIEDEADIRVLHNTFNAGLFLVDESLLNDKIYHELLALVDSRIYKTPNMNLTDQVILNLYFANRAHLVSGKYNYLLAHSEAIFRRENIEMQNAAVLHFNGHQKPWMTGEILASSLGDTGFLKACVWWFESYTKALQKLHLQANAKKFRDEKLNETLLRS